MFYMGFLGGLSENDWKSLYKRDHQFTRHLTRMGCRVKYFFLHQKGFRRHILTNDTHWHAPRTPQKSGFFEWKRPKEGEIVVLGHSHERVGEIPRPYENFGVSRSKKSLFVPEIEPFEVGIVVNQISLCKIWTLLMGYNWYLIYKGLNTSDTSDKHKQLFPLRSVTFSGYFFEPSP